MFSIEVDVLFHDNVPVVGRKGKVHLCSFISVFVIIFLMNNYIDGMNGCLMVVKTVFVMYTLIFIFYRFYCIYKILYLEVNDVNKAEVGNKDAKTDPFGPGFAVFSVDIVRGFCFADSL